MKLIKNNNNGKFDKFNQSFWNRKQYWLLFFHDGTQCIEILLCPIFCDGILLGPLALYSIIWFERFGSDEKRTLLNMLFSMICWTCIGFCLCIQVIDAQGSGVRVRNSKLPPPTNVWKVCLKNAIKPKMSIPPSPPRKFSQKHWPPMDLVKLQLPPLDFQTVCIYDSGSRNCSFRLWSFAIFCLPFAIAVEVYVYQHAFTFHWCYHHNQVTLTNFN